MGKLNRDVPFLTPELIEHYFKISAADAEDALMLWPAIGVDLTTPCIKRASNHVYFGGKLQRPLAAFAEAAVQRKLHPLWRLKRSCCTPGCKQLLHYHPGNSYDPFGIIDQEDWPI